MQRSVVGQTAQMTLRHWIVIALAFGQTFCASTRPVATISEAKRPTDPVINMSGVAYLLTCELRRSGAQCRNLGFPEETPVPPGNTAELDGACLRTLHGRVLCTNGIDPFWPVGGLLDVVALSAAGDYGCALRRDGSVGCWELTNDDSKRPGSMASDVTNLPRTVQIDVGYPSCAVLDDSGVACWHRSRSAEVIPGLSDVRQVISSGGAVCAVLLSGSVSCWGDNDYGQLGDGGTRSRRAVPRLIPGLDRVRQLSAAGESFCALRGDGEVWCWGGRAWSQHGERPPAINCPRPTRVPGLDRVTWIHMNGEVLCAMDERGKRTCLSDEPRYVALYAAGRRHWLDACRQ